MKRLPDPAHEALVSWMRSLTLAQHLPIARVCMTFTVFFGQNHLSRVSSYKTLHTSTNNRSLWGDKRNCLTLLVATHK